MKRVAILEHLKCLPAALGACLMLACGAGDGEPAAPPGSRPSQAREQPLAVRTPDATALFDWAETAYPQYFPSHRFNQSAPPYVFRYYPETGNYVGLSGSTVAVLGPISGGAVLTVGQVSDFACQVYPSDCAPAIGSYAFAAIAPTLVTSRAMHTATLLPDGTVLIAGGFASSSFPSAALNTAELFDPVANTFTALSARMRSTRTSHAATLLPNGQVLITGGQADNNNGDGVGTAEIYDPTTRTFSSVAAAMKSPRGGHSSTLLPSGKVLLAAGFYRGAGTLISDAELYDPTTQTFAVLAARMSLLGESQGATLLSSGKVLITGGSTSAALNMAELFDPATQAFTLLSARMTAVRAGHDSTLLPSGLVLLTGGAPVFSPTGLVALKSAEVFDPGSQAFTSISATMVTSRVGHAAVLLRDGSVLLTGGLTVLPTGAFAVLNTAEVFKPATPQ